MPTAPLRHIPYAAIFHVSLLQEDEICLHTLNALSKLLEPLTRLTFVIGRASDILGDQRDRDFVSLCLLPILRRRLLSLRFSAAIPPATSRWCCADATRSKWSRSETFFFLAVDPLRSCAGVIDSDGPRLMAGGDVPEDAQPESSSTIFVFVFVFLLRRKKKRKTFTLCFQTSCSLFVETKRKWIAVHFSPRCDNFSQSNRDGILIGSIIYRLPFGLAKLAAQTCRPGSSSVFDDRPFGVCMRAGIHVAQPICI